MPELTELDPAAARDWIARWDRQQEVYLPDREDRFTALIDAVEAGTGRPDPLVLDLGCGPGSLAVRLLARLPAATVIAVDADPVTLSLGRAAYAGVPGCGSSTSTCGHPGGRRELGLEPGRPVDAVVSTTALHWLTAAELRELYRVLASLLRPAGCSSTATTCGLTRQRTRCSRDWTGCSRRRRPPPLPRRSRRPRRGLGASGGRPSPRTRRSRTRSPNANAARSTTTGRRARCSPCTPARSARPGSPRSGPSGTFRPVSSHTCHPTEKRRKQPRRTLVPIICRSTDIKVR